MASANALAQRGGLMNDPGPLMNTSTAYSTSPGTGVLIFTVCAERSGVHLDRQALMKLVNHADNSALWQTTEDTSTSIFTNVPYGVYDVEVSAVGYLSAHRELSVLSSLRPSDIEIVLKRDPSALKLDVSDSVMSPKARKQAKQAVSSLKSNDLKQAERKLAEAYKLAPSSPDVNFLFGYLYYQKKDFTQAGNYLGTAANLSPHNAQVLTLLGRAGLERKDYPAARSALERAILVDANNWLPHGLLADTYLRQKDYGKARDEAQAAIAKGGASAKSDSAPAQLVLGEALLGLGQEQDGIKALNLFLEQSPRHPMSGQVRALIADLNDRPAVANSGESSAAGNVPPSGLHITAVDPLEALPPPGLSLKPWQPAGVDDVKPPVASDVACPIQKVIDESGKRVDELVEDIARFSAIEDLFHQSLDPYGIPVRTETRKYDYVAAITRPQPGLVLVDEFRSDKLMLSGYPDQIASTGFATLALVFHPDMRSDFEMTCEGLGDWHGQAAWLVHFRQLENRPNRMHSYKVGNRVFRVDLKGRAWITADKFQIVRIEADMVKPIPEIRLLSEHQVVEYGPIPFPRKNATLWLPKNAEIYFDFRKHHYYRRHSFDHYMLFSVDSEEKRNEPQVKKEAKQEPAKSPGN
ncbi:MAG TPA: tetratricopeptide repeat protein [Candidatus Sulfotelmatobacter sp.]|nr:tetratricopeptide repeat protein [Candidatus Sulfotelmatobacter sp.]